MNDAERDQARQAARRHDSWDNGKADIFNAGWAAGVEFARASEVEVRADERKRTVTEIVAALRQEADGSENPRRRRAFNLCAQFIEHASPVVAGREFDGLVKWLEAPRSGARYDPFVYRAAAGLVREFSTVDAGEGGDK